MKKIILGLLPSFLPLALAITLTFGVFYVTVQQNYRMSANDPQIQIAEDIASQLEKGAPPQYFIPQVKIDISKSLGSFIMIFDGKGNLTASSGVIDNKALQLPQGVFNTTKQKGETRFTWQPQNNTRIALVVKYYNKPKEGFIAIGRSLREVEQREDNLTKIIFVGWIFTLAAVYSLMVLQKKIS